MYVIPQERPAPTALPGIEHSTWAGSAEGLDQLSLWRQSIAPGVATPPHSHDCDEVVLCQGGSGEVHIDGRVHRFGADSTVVVPRGVMHQIFSVGTVPLEILGILAAPVTVRLPDGSMLDVPWRT